MTKKLPKPLRRISRGLQILVLIFEHLELSRNISHEKEMKRNAERVKYLLTVPPKELSFQE